MKTESVTMQRILGEVTEELGARIGKKQNFTVICSLPTVGPAQTALLVPLLPPTVPHTLCGPQPDLVALPHPFAMGVLPTHPL